jgi:CBS domain-containing protein
MTPDPVTVSVDTIATKIRSILRDNDFRALPVVNGSRLEGMISRGDIINISAAKSNVDTHGIMDHISLNITEDMDINEAGKRLLQAEEVQSPVIRSTEDMHLVGMLSVVDVLKKFVDDENTPKYKKIDDIVTKDVVICSYDDLISKVWNKMDDTGFSGIPVLKKKKLIGIITRKDIINSGHARIVKESDDIKGSTNVENIMKTPPIVATSDKEVKEIDEGVITIENIGTALKDILKVAQTVSRQASEVSAISDDLAKNSEDIVGKMEDISSITEETAAQAEEISSITEEQTASLEEISAGAQTFAKVADTLIKQVNTFKI